MEPEETQPMADRRAVPPVSLDVIAFQVGALQTSVDRGLSAMERTIDRGLSDVKVEVAGLSNRVGDIELTLTSMGTRVEALEAYRRQEEERLQLAHARDADRLEVATTDQSKFRVYVILGGLVFALIALGGFIIALLQLLGGQ